MKLVDSDGFTFMFESSAFPVMYISYGFWIMLHLQNVVFALFYAILGELAWSLFLGLCTRCQSWFGEPECLARIFFMDILSRAIGIVLLGKLASVLFRVPPLVPSFWSSDKRRVSNWYRFGKYALQVWSVRVAGLLVTHRQRVFGVEDYPLGQVAFMMFVILLPLLFYYWNRPDYRRYVPPHLYFRTYLLAACTMGLLNALYLLEFTAALLEGLLISLLLASIYVWAYYTFARREDARLIGSSVTVPVREPLLRSERFTNVARHFLPYFAYDDHALPKVSTSLYRDHSLRFVHEINQ